MNATLMNPNPKPVKHSFDRGNVMTINLRLTEDDFVENDNEIYVKLPLNAEVVIGAVNVVDTFNTTGTDTIKIGDDVDDDRYLAATNLKAAARTALTTTGHQTTGETMMVKITRTPADANATKGQVNVFIGYIFYGDGQYTEGE